MLKEKSLVIFKNRPALVSGYEGEKISITVYGGETYKVREKDIELLHSGPCALKDLEENAPSGNVREAWELLAEETDAAAKTSLKELAELVYGAFTPRSAWAAWEVLREGLYFTGEINSLRARPRTDVLEEEKKREEKQRESGDRAAFLEKLKKLPPFKGLPVEGLPPADHRHLQDVEALARGQSGKSRTLKELGRSETPEEAHRLLLAAGAWTVWVNPHPARFGIGRDSAKSVLPPTREDRLDLTSLASFAIDNPWSGDPDDAVSLEGPGEDGRHCLWVHVADPAASVLPESPADLEARDRGSTLYLPEGPCRMLNIEALPLFALGLSDVSPALSFKIVLNADLTIHETEIIPSLVKVTRLTYAEADALISKGTDSVLTALAALAERNVERRLDTGAVLIDLPEAHITVQLGQNPEKTGISPSESQISVEPLPEYRSADMVRECMIWAGEGTARWALQRQLPFPFISQEEGELPERRLSGLAGAWQLRRCMKPRNLSAKPGVHWGLGLDQYTQVTSPLRRYVDLLCHQQIRASINSGLYKGRPPLSEEEVLFRAAAAEAASAAVNRAERASRSHWLAVYLCGKKGSAWDGVILDRKGSKGTVSIPALGLETQVHLRGNEEPNEQVRLILSSVKIPEAEVYFEFDAPY